MQSMTLFPDWEPVRTETDGAGIFKSPVCGVYVRVSTALGGVAWEWATEGDYAEHDQNPHWSEGGTAPDEDTALAQAKERLCRSDIT